MPLSRFLFYTRPSRAWPNRKRKGTCFHDDLEPRNPRCVGLGSLLDAGTAKFCGDMQRRQTGGTSAYQPLSHHRSVEVKHFLKKQIRHYAIVILQRALLSPTLSSGPPQVCFSCFDQVLAPLPHSLLFASRPQRFELTSCFYHADHLSTAQGVVRAAPRSSC